MRTGLPSPPDVDYTRQRPLPEITPEERLLEWKDERDFAISELMGVMGAPERAEERALSYKMRRADPSWWSATYYSEKVSGRPSAVEL
ncbi:hypothetical protein HDU93_003050, partial [Gonapodya sp. JEL0774]